MFWVVHCMDRANSEEARQQYREVHRDYLSQYRDNIFFSGPLWAEDGETQIGSLFIVELPTKADAESYIRHEPFYNAGIFEHIKIYPITKGRYHPALMGEPKLS